MYDLIIKNGTVIDGSGSKGFRADLGITDGRIAGLGELGSNAGRIIDAEGCIVSPGFIDIHAHTDALAMLNPTFESKLTQGVTTEVSGNCGYASAPRGGLHGEVSEDDGMLGEWGVKADWRSLGELFDRLDAVPLGINFATLVGHGDIRAVAMGYDARKPSAEELDCMRRLVAEAMEDGAFGLSSGLIYPPSCYGDTDELAALSRVAAENGGIYSSHIRSESGNLLEAVEEALEIGRRSGARVQLSHHKACGWRNWGKVKQSLALIDKARAEGIDVSADQYPYTATSTGLGTMLPDWAHDGGTSALLARLRDAQQREAIREEVLRTAREGWIEASGGWEVTVISCVGKEHNRRLEGLNLEEVSSVMGKEPVDAVLDLLLDEDGGVSIIRFVIDENDVKTVMRHPAIVFGSDATARINSGPLGRGKPHPRSYGTFPRILGKYVREEKVLPLEEAVAKMTGRSAAILSLSDRGMIKDGWFADVNIFDPNEIADTATFAIPHSHAKGIKYVIVNGQVVIDDGCITEARPGRVLRSRRA